MSTRKTTTTAKAKETPLQDDVSLDPSRAGSVAFEQVQRQIQQSNLSTVSAQVLAQRAATSSYVPSPYTQVTPAAAEEQAVPTNLRVVNVPTLPITSIPILTSNVYTKYITPNIFLHELRYSNTIHACQYD